MRRLVHIPRRALSRFVRDEDAAVTVDWVVLTAAIVGLAIALYTQIGNATDDHADRIGAAIDTQGIRTD